jgi:CheY-like chemotaxis protein
MNMPKMNGMETLRRIRSNPKTKNIAVIIFTTASRIDSGDNFSKLSIEHFEKPIEYKKFYDVAVSSWKNVRNQKAGHRHIPLKNAAKQ